MGLLPTPQPIHPYTTDESTIEGGENAHRTSRTSRDRSHLPGAQHILHVLCLLAARQSNQPPHRGHGRWGGEVVDHATDPRALRTNWGRRWTERTTTRRGQSGAQSWVLPG